MRSLRYSLACALGVASCGAKPQPDRAADTAISIAPADVVVVQVGRRDALGQPSRPLGRTLRLTATTLGDLYVLDCDNNRVLRYGQGGELMGEAGGSGTGTNQFSSPVDLDADGQTVWILDRQNRRLVRLNRILNHVEEIPLAPPADQLEAPLWYDGVSAAANGDVFLLDKRAPQAVRVSPAGEILCSYGGFGSGNGRLEGPSDLDAAQDGSLFVLDGRRLLIYDRSGNFQLEVRHSEPLARVEASTRDAWITTASGELLWYADGRLYRATAVTETLPRPVDLTLLAGRDPVLLDAGATVWLCRAPSD
jgi:hypothetical protein